MDKEFAFIILLPISSLLGMLGGYRWKWMRRYILPIIFGIICFIYGISLFNSFLVFLIGGISFSLPYGENSSWIIRILTAISFGLISVPIGLTWWQIIPPITFLICWILSNKYKLQWKICEAITWFAIALPIANLLYYIN